MGLDGVELVMAVEEEFGVSLIDDDLVKVVTPRLLGDLVFSKLQHAEESVCQSQHAFHILRRALVQAFGLGRKQVTIELRLRDFIAREREKDSWFSLKEACQARTWPALDYPAWLISTRRAASLVIVVASVSLAVHAGVFWGTGLGAGFLLVCGAVALETD